MSDDLFVQVALVMLLAAVAGLLATTLRQPLIVAFIAVGLLVGPSALGIVEPDDQLALLAEIGVSLLLFVVGLKLDVRLLRAAGPVALAAGLGQIAFTAGIGFPLALALGMGAVEALYIAVALTFSSTIIIVKLLTDKRDLDELYGRIAIGILIVQDIVVVLLMILLTALGGESEETAWRAVVEIVATGLLLLAVLAAAARWFLTPVLHRVARTPELLLVFAVAWAIGLAAGASALGFSSEVGAFLAGIALASTPYREVLGGRLAPIRDFLLLFFFVELGAKVELGLLDEQLLAAGVLSVFVLVGNPLIVMAILGFMRYRRRVSFLTGLTVAQVSEFSLILAALGLSLGHIGEETLGLVTAVALVTIGVSTYLILGGERLYRRLAPSLGVFERTRTRAEETESSALAAEVVVLGLGRYGGAIATGFQRAGISVLGVDFDPRSLAEWEARGLPVLFGDVEDPALPDALPLRSVRWIVSTIRRLDDNVALLHALRDRDFRGKVAVAAELPDDAPVLERAGADRVLLPFSEAADEFVRSLSAKSAEGAR